MNNDNQNLKAENIASLERHALEMKTAYRKLNEKCNIILEKIKAYQNKH